MNYQSLIELLKSKGVSFANGLCDDDYSFIYEQYHIIFPPDLKELLSSSQPISSGFIIWSDKSSSNIDFINKMIDWPIESILFDVINNSFWYKYWGEKPKSIEESIITAKSELLKVPKMIPIFKHRYIPMSPSENNNPVFSIYQSDVIYYGDNLYSYLEIEFNLKDYNTIQNNHIKQIDFWSNLI